MSNQSKPVNQNRRQFMKLMTTGSLFCMGCGALCASAPLSLTGKKSPAGQGSSVFQESSKMSMEAVCKFAYDNIGIKAKLLMDILIREYGREKALKMIKEASAKSGELEAKGVLRKLKKDDMVTYTDELRKPEYLVKHIIVYEILKDTPKDFSVKITECLWEKTFRRFNALDLGFALFCSRDFTTAKSYNPKIRLIRSKSLMQGDEYCNHRWVYEG